MSISGVDNQTAVPNQDEHTVSPDSTAYLNQLLTRFENKLQSLEKLTDTVPPTDVQRACADIHFASRSAFSEYTALQIDRIPLGNTQVLQIHSLHKTAIAALEKRIEKAPLVSLYLDSVRQCLKELGSIE